MNRRRLLTYAGASFALAALGACGRGSGTNEQADANGAVGLRMAWWGSPVRHEQTQAVLDYVTEQNPDIKVTAEPGGLDGFFAKLATQAAAGDAPDLFQMTIRYLGEFANQGTTLDLEPYFGGLLDVSAFNPTALEAGRANGQLSAVSLGDNTITLIADLDLFDEVGVEFPNLEAWTWDDYATLVERISADTPEGVYGALDEGGQDQMAEVFMGQRGKTLYDQNGQLGIEKQDLIDFWSMWDDFRRSGIVAPAEMMGPMGRDIPTSQMVQQKTALECAWSNQLVAYQEATTRNLGITTVPHADQEPDGWGQFTKPAQMVSIFSGTEHPEEAVEVLNYFVSDVEAGLIRTAERGVPGSSAVREAMAGDLSGAERLALDIVDAVAKNQRPLEFFPVAAAGESSELFYRMYEAIAFGSTSVEDGADAYFAEAERIFG